MLVPRLLYHPQHPQFCQTIDNFQLLFVTAYQADETSAHEKTATAGNVIKLREQSNGKDSEIDKQSSRCLFHLFLSNTKKQNAVCQ